MRIITLGQPVVSKTDYCIDNKQILWGYIVEADVNTGKGVILHAIDIGTDSQPVRIDVYLSTASTGVLAHSEGKSRTIFINSIALYKSLSSIKIVTKNYPLVALPNISCYVHSKNPCHLEQSV